MRGGKYINEFAARMLASAAAIIPDTSWILASAPLVDLSFSTSQYSGASAPAVTRNLAAYGKNANGSLQLFGANVARITDLGLLIEGARTNLCTQSEAATGWNAGNTVLAINADVAPNGTTTALKITDNTSNVSHSASPPVAGFNVTSGQTYTFSMFFKAGTGSAASGFAQITCAGGQFSGGGAVNVNLSTGATQSVGTGVLGFGAESYTDGNGVQWWRAWLTQNATASAATNVSVGMITNISALRLPAYIGTGSTIFVWGAQCENAAYMSSYIPTTTVSVQRPADVVVASGTLLTALQSAAMTVQVQTNTFKQTGTATLLHDATNSHLLLGYNSTPNGVSNLNSAGTAITAATGVPSRNILSKVTLAGDNTGRSIIVNNDVVVSDANAIQSSSSIYLGGSDTQNNMLDGCISRITVWGSRLSNTTIKKNLSQIRSISTRGLVTQGAIQATTGTTVCLEGRTRHVVADDTPWLKLSLVGYYDTSTAETAMGNDTAIEVAVEIPTLSQTVRFNFGGSSTGTIVNNVTEYLTDKVLASSFGLINFTRGTVYWLRWRRVVPLNGFHPNFDSNTGITGENAYYSDGASPSQVMGSGAMSTPTGGSVANVAIVPANIIGFAPGNISVYGIGDSILAGSDDNAGDGNNGGGWFARGLLSVNARQYAFARGARGSSTATNFVGNSAKRFAQFKYHSHGVCHYGTNDMSPNGSNLSAASTLTAVASVVELMKAGGMGYVAASKVIPRTNGGGAPATQTPEAGFETAGAKRDPFNTGLVVAGGIDQVFDMSSAVADTTVPSPDKWTQGYTAQGIHPSAGTPSAAMATVFNGVVAAWV